MSYSQRKICNLPITNACVRNFNFIWFCAVCPLHVSYCLLPPSSPGFPAMLPNHTDPLTRSENDTAASFKITCVFLIVYRQVQSFKWPVCLAPSFSLWLCIWLFPATADKTHVPPNHVKKHMYRTKKKNIYIYLSNYLSIYLSIYMHLGGQPNWTDKQATVNTAVATNARRIWIPYHFAFTHKHLKPNPKNLQIKTSRHAWQWHSIFCPVLRFHMKAINWQEIPNGRQPRVAAEATGTMHTACHMDDWFQLRCHCQHPWKTHMKFTRCLFTVHKIHMLMQIKSVKGTHYWWTPWHLRPFTANAVFVFFGWYSLALQICYCKPKTK